MPYQPHTLVTLGGTLTEITGDDEIFQFGVRGFNNGSAPVNEGDLQHLAEVILNGPTGSGGGVSNLWTDARGRITTEAKLVWCKAANIGADGKYTGEPGVAQQAPLAGVTSRTMPEFCSVAISWTTGYTLGRAVRGRIYPPNAGAELGAGSTVFSSATTAIAAWAKDLLSVLDTSGLLEEGVPTFIPHVVSQYGVSRVITGGRVGNVVDTQRRRKDKHGETYTTFTKAS